MNTWVCAASQVAAHPVTHTVDESPHWIQFMNLHPEPVVAKPQLRRALRRSRQELTEAFRTHAAAGFTRAVDELHRRHPSGPVLVYLPTGLEPPIESALRTLLPARDLWLPVTVAHRGLAWCPWRTTTSFAPTGPAGLLEPVGPRLQAPPSPAFVVVPCLAVDEDGVRLGMGGGYYDTFLATLDPSVPRIGCVFAAEVLPAGSVPRDSWDALLPAVVTEHGLRDLSA